MSIIMKLKYKLNLKKLLFIPLFILLFFQLNILQNKTNAQNSNSLFDTKFVIRQEKINANSKTPLVLSLYPFTTLVFQPGSFKSDVTIYVYKDNFINIKNILPKGQSPISSYYFIFKNSEDKIVLPLIPLRVQSYNNYINTNTYFYPLSTASQIDKLNQKEYKGHINVNTNLPINDSGFIVAANIELNGNDETLNPTTITEKIINTKQNQKLNNLFALFPFIVIFIIIVFIVGLILFNSRKRKKQI